MKNIFLLTLIFALQACGMALLDPGTRSSISPALPTPNERGDDIPTINTDPSPLAPPSACDGGVTYKNAPADISVVMPETVNAYPSSSLVSSITFTVHATTDGYRDIWIDNASESGASQPDEHAIILIKNASNPEGLPANPNASPYFVIADNDNNGAPTDTRQYAGRFWFDAGDQDVEVIHYCQIYEELLTANGGIEDSNNMFFSFHNGTCIDSPPSLYNSVHFGTDRALCSQEQ